jgi:Mg2+-importing ATPase
VIKAQRALGQTVGFLGDGVNDAVALHDADVGISVETATDVAKDAADIVPLAKDLDILATGVREGRRIFANTINDVLMGPSSNFGNMFSAGGASLFLSFLPMLPTQILLNKLALRRQRNDDPDRQRRFHALATLFRSGWFVESLATQSLVIFAIRTRRDRKAPANAT